MTLVLQWARAFALTLSVEVAIVLPMTRDLPVATARRAALIGFANLASHPAVWFIFPLIIRPGELAGIAASEAWAVVIEAVYYVLVFRVGVARGLGVSAIANGVSFGLGMLIRATTGWV